MLFKDVIAKIRFNTSTTDDLSGNTNQPLFNNAALVSQLNFSLDRYANYTKAIEAVYSTQADNEINSLAAPSDILRSQGIRFLMVYNKGLRYPLIQKDPNNVYGNFYVQNISGIPGWFLYWGDEVQDTIQLYPTNSVAPIEANLSQSISATSTTINLVQTTNLPLRNGRITIGSEKILYRVLSGTQLQNCTRGVEGTVAAPHDASSLVLENNCHMLYRKLHWKAVVGPAPEYAIDPIYANREMEIPDEHIEAITDWTSYKLLKKIPSQSALAETYKIDFEKWLGEAKYDIQKGRSEIQKTDDVRDQYWFESEETAYRYF